MLWYNILQRMDKFNKKTGNTCSIQVFADNSGFFYPDFAVSNKSIEFKDLLELLSIIKDNM